MSHSLVEGDEPGKMHRQMAEALDEALDRIATDPAAAPGITARQGGRVGR